MKVCLAMAFTWLLMATCHAQVVQLPAVGSFQVNTTVSVPDQGTASLGGVGRSRTATARGLGPNAVRGGQVGTTSASVTATVIDLAAMDEALLNMPTGSTNVANFAAPRQGTKIVNTLVPHHYETANVQNSAQRHPYDWMVALGPQGSVQQDSAEAKIRDGSNARYFMEKAAAAQNQGHTAAARVYYQMAIDRLTPAQRKRLDDIRTSRSAKTPEKTKKGQDGANTTEAAADATQAPAAGSGENTASPFDPPAGEAGANTDMTSSPF